MIKPAKPPAPITFTGKDGKKYRLGEYRMAQSGERYLTFSTNVRLNAIRRWIQNSLYTATGSTVVRVWTCSVVRTTKKP
jgi:hypothetical protein